MLSANERELIYWRHLDAEYVIVQTKWWAFQGLRYVALGFYALFTDRVTEKYQSSIQALSIGEELSGLLALVLAFVGIAVTAAVWLLTERLRRLYGECSRRGAEIEQIAGNSNGIFSCLEAIGLPGVMAPYNFIIRFLFAILIAFYSVLGAAVLYR
jgi:hypothetical protein